MQESELQRHGRLEADHWWFRARREILCALTDRYLRPHGGALLDVGCGSGGNLKALQSRFAEAHGLDVSATAAALSRQAGAVGVYLGGPEAVPREVWPRLDMVLLADVLEHIESDRAFLAQILEQLPGGALVIITVPAGPALFGPHDRALGHYRRYDLAGFTALWRDQEVDTLLLSPFNCLLYPLMWVVRRLFPGSGSDLRRHSFLINTLLYHVFRLEQLLLPHIRLPWGASYLCVLRKR